MQKLSITTKFLPLSILSLTILIAGCETTSSSSSSSSTPTASSPSSTSMPSPSSSSSMPSPASTASTSSSGSGASSSASSPAGSDSASSASADGSQGSSGAAQSGSSTAGSPSASAQQGQEGIDVSVSVPGAQGLPGLGLPGLPGGDPLETGSSSSTSGSSTNSGSGNSNQQGGSVVGTGSIGNGSGTGSGSGDDPFADLANGRGGASTSAERRAELDARLEESYSVFDGMILTEREQVQNGEEPAGNGRNGQGAGSETFGNGEGSTVVAAGPQNSTGGGVMPAGGRNREGDYTNQNQETFPVPEDIPNGNNDDVVARQLREAAMSEADPELREALWDEYRSYTGLSQ